MSVWAQDPLVRMDPADWFQLPEIQNAWEIVRADKHAYRVSVRCTKGDLASIPGSGGTLFHRPSDIRMVIDSTGAMIGQSHNYGFNNGARHFFWDGRAFALGGRGFWEDHAKLVEFVPTTGEWELSPAAGAPDHCIDVGSWFDEDGARAIAMEYFGAERIYSEHCRLVRSLDVTSSKWTTLGMANPVLDLYFLDGRSLALDFKEYFLWLGLHKSVVIRKSDLKAVVSAAFNKGQVNRFKRNESGDFGFIVDVFDQGKWERRQQWSPDGDGEILFELDVAEVFTQLQSEAIEFVVPAHHDEDQAEEGQQGNAAYPSMWWLTLVLMAGAFILGKGMRKKALANEVVSGAEVSGGRERQGESTFAAQGNDALPFSELTRMFIALGNRQMDTIELNAFLDLDTEQSEETKRARRAQAIRDVNREYNLFYGVDLIERIKDASDRRRTTYIIRPDSGTA